MINRRLETSTVVINLKTDTVFKGVYWKRRRNYVILKNVQLIQPTGETLSLDGEVLIERSNIDFIQIL